MAINDYYTAKPNNFPYVLRHSQRPRGATIPHHSLPPHGSKRIIVIITQASITTAAPILTSLR